MKLLILGAGGQVGAALLRAAEHSVGLTHAACDVRDPDAVKAAVARHRPSLLVNCAAYTAVDRAEAERALAFAINAEGAGNAAAAAAAFGTPILHLSSDYVYGAGETGPHQEDEAVAPLCVYGASKAAGDAAVAAANPRHIILRVSWVFSAEGANFVRTMLRLARERRELRVVDDQIGGPTAATDIAAAVLAIAAQCASPVSGASGFSGWGIYHFSGAPVTSWCGFARAILAGAGLATPVVPIATADYPTAAQRPQNSVLDGGKIMRVFAIGQPDWRLALNRILSVGLDTAKPA